MIRNRRVILAALLLLASGPTVIAALNPADAQTIDACLKAAAQTGAKECSWPI